MENMTYKLNEKKDEVSASYAGAEYRFWIHGAGLIPLHRNKSIAEDRMAVYLLKKELRKAGLMEGEQRK